ncbi:MAG: PspC domain-containing protein [Candidatus Taylorbacteria bacterium]|nr:PspC domain-containing protein [Candidatus Taylorbacteria bacterium]
MKKAFQISIAGTLFSIEEDAYQRLDGYISQVKRHFAQTAGSEEIVRDIEARIAEQLLDAKRAVVSIMEVDAVIATMGKVEDFEDGIGDEASPEAESKQKKLYRDSDDRVIAGVCSGLARYFGTDPLWVRIAFVVLMFVLNGFPLFAYIVLWIVMPEAKTAAQKLEMSGSPVNLETLSENIKEKVDKASQRHGSTIRRILSAPFIALKAIATFVRKALFPLVRIAFGLALGVMTLGAILASSFGAPFFLTSPERLADFPITEAIPLAALYAAVMSAYFVVVIPAALLFAFALYVLRKKTVLSGGAIAGFLGLWLVSIVSLGASAAVSVASYESYTRTSPLFEIETRDIAIEGPLTGLYASFGQKVTIVRGDEVSLTATGRRKDLDSVSAENRDGVLSVSQGRKKDSCLFCDARNPDLVLTVPSLSSIKAGHGSAVESESLWKSDGRFEIELLFGSKVDMKIEADSVVAKAEHGSRLKLEGTAKTASFEALFGSTIDALGLIADDVSARTEFGASITASASKTLDARASNGGIIRYDGDPTIEKGEDFGGEIDKI